MVGVWYKQSSLNQNIFQEVLYLYNFKKKVSLKSFPSENEFV